MKNKLISTSVYLLFIFIVYVIGIMTIPYLNVFQKINNLYSDKNQTSYYMDGNLVKDDNITNDCTQVKEYEMLYGGTGEGPSTYYTNISQKTIINDSEYVLNVGFYHTSEFYNNPADPTIYSQYIVKGKEQAKEFYIQNVKMMWEEIKKNYFNKILEENNMYSYNFLGVSKLNIDVKINDKNYKYYNYSIINEKTLIGGLCKKIELQFQ